MEAGTAATGAEARKCNKCAGLSTTYQFEPIAVETTGVYGPSTMSFLDVLGRRIRETTGVLESPPGLDRICPLPLKGAMPSAFSRLAGRGFRGSGAAHQVVLNPSLLSYGNFLFRSDFILNFFF